MEKFAVCDGIMAWVVISQSEHMNKVNVGRMRRRLCRGDFIYYISAPFVSAEKPFSRKVSALFPPLPLIQELHVFHTMIVSRGAKTSSLLAEKKVKIKRANETLVAASPSLALSAQNSPFARSRSVFALAFSRKSLSV